MKKVFLTLSLVAAAFFCQAQLFIGGDLGFGVTGGKVSGSINNVSETYDLPKTTTFEIVPTIGFMFNENIGIGLDFGYGISNYKEKDDEESYKKSMNSWVVAPYFRWVFGHFDRVSLYADAKIGFGGDKSKYTLTEEELTFNADGDKVFNFGFNIVPGINFMLNDNIALNAKLNLISLGYNMTKVTSKEDADGYFKGDDELEITTKNTSFGFGVNYRTALEVGFVYQF